MLTTEPSEAADQPSADVHVSMDVKHGIHLAMRMDHVIIQFVEAQPEVWKCEHLVCRYDR